MIDQSERLFTIRFFLVGSIVFVVVCITAIDLELGITLAKVLVSMAMVAVWVFLGVRAVQAWKVEKEIKGRKRN